jgi:hypothetical protein
LYADDAVVFLNPFQADVDMLMVIMQRFGDATGLRINVNKSTVAPIRCSQVNLDEILQNFDGPHVALLLRASNNSWKVKAGAPSVCF